MKLDLYLFNSTNKFAGKQKWLDFLAIFFAKWLPYLMVVFLFLFAFLSQNIYLFLTPILAGLFSRYVINEIIYFFYKRKRPPEVVAAKTLIKVPKHPAFPSGHASMFFGLSFVLLFFNVNLGIIFIVLSFLVCFFRIFSGVHWPSDILAGVVAGVASAFLAMNFRTIDSYLFSLIRGLAGKYVWFDYSGMFFASYFEYLLLLFLFVFLLINIKKHWKTVLLALVSAGVSRFIFTIIIRELWFRQRPFVAQNFIPLINQNPAEASFPSGHASFYFALSTIIYLYNKKLGALFFLGSFLIAISRVFAGVHWPSDIFAGAVLGILTALVIDKIFRKNENYIFGNR